MLCAVTATCYDAAEPAPNPHAAPVRCGRKMSIAAAFDLLTIALAAGAVATLWVVSMRRLNTRRARTRWAGFLTVWTAALAAWLAVLYALDHDAVQRATLGFQVAVFFWNGCWLIQLLLRQPRHEPDPYRWSSSD